MVDAHTDELSVITYVSTLFRSLKNGVYMCTAARAPHTHTPYIHTHIHTPYIHTHTRTDAKTQEDELLALMQTTKCLGLGLWWVSVCVRVALVGVCSCVWMGGVGGGWGVILRDRQTHTHTQRKREREREKEKGIQYIIHEERKSHKVHGWIFWV